MDKEQEIKISYSGPRLNKNMMKYGDLRDLTLKRNLKNYLLGRIVLPMLEAALGIRRKRRDKATQSAKMAST